MTVPMPDGFWDESWNKQWLNPQKNKPIKTDEDLADWEKDLLGHDKLTFDDKAAKVYVDAMGVLLRKHKDYGPKNISLSPGGPLNGLRVRMWDKLARINNLIDSGAQPENESLRDSFLDLLNYSAIALLVLDGDWPE